MEGKDGVFASADEAIDLFRKGQILIVTDDEDRENEGDFVIAADWITPETVNFMVTHGRGLFCLPATGERLDELGIPMMTKDNTTRHGTPFAEAIDAREGTTTGISAFDRARTVRLFVDPGAQPSDFVRPGHVFPLRAQEGGVLKRAGHTEAVVDLAHLAGLSPAGALCEILNEDGSMARMPQLIEIAKKHGMKIVTIAELIEYRRRTERLVKQAAGPLKFPTQFGEFQLYAFESEVDSNPFIALTVGDVASGEPVLVRMHSSCITGDVLGSLRCDCGNQLHLAMKAISREGRGALVYIPHEGRGIGLINKLKAYALQDLGLDTVEANRALGFKADLRDYGIGAQILLLLGIRSLRLMTNNPAKISGLEGYGLKVVEHVPIVAEPTEHNRGYLLAKVEKLGHMIDQSVLASEEAE
ncbi:MAG: bifunctional 3,4-dihydroxy-2-butanone-4-phosphate synthase/GTP cyclohydrolase II [Armatimonadetes bacterium]|nr:bifunctional 3,4-dihydroxy-2-butanone-4-phosphate synthase/GTP cyclohydrolase II [Armatimonadota bacterium]